MHFLQNLVIPQFKVRNSFFLHSIFPSVLVEWNKLDSDICNSPSYSIFKKKKIWKKKNLILFLFVVLIWKFWITSFSTAQVLAMKGKIFCLRLKASTLIFLEKQTLVLHQYFFVVPHVFQLNLAPTYSTRLLTTFYLQKGLNWLSLDLICNVTFLNFCFPASSLIDFFLFFVLFYLHFSFFC